MAGLIGSGVDAQFRPIHGATAQDVYMVGAVFHRSDIIVATTRIPNPENLGRRGIGRPKLDGCIIFNFVSTDIHAVTGVGCIIDFVDIVIAVAEVISRISGGGIAEVPEELGRHVGGDIGPLGAIEITSIIVRQRTHRLPLAVDHHLKGDAVAEFPGTVLFGRYRHR